VEVSIHAQIKDLKKMLRDINIDRENVEVALRGQNKELKNKLQRDSCLEATWISRVAH
jgi:vacuolar-type H+-ATPase subunit C/Vma6